MNLEETEDVAVNLGTLEMDQPFSIIFFGATGDLARKKLYPAVGALHRQGLLPSNLQVVATGRRDVDMPSFIEKQCPNVKGTEAERQELYKHMNYVKVKGAEDYDALQKHLEAFEGDGRGNRVFFLSIPPSAFGSTTKMIKDHCESKTGYTHVIIEKPFGYDSASYEELDKQTSACFPESQIYRIDHYMGKEVVLNLMTLRFANSMFEPIWNNQHIESIQVTMKEDLGTPGRGAFFDKAGMVRDVCQNHLLQVLIFLTMDEPESMQSDHVQASKVNLLKAMQVIQPEDVFIGQWTANKFRKNGEERHEVGYTEQEDVSSDSMCPTFAQICIKVDSDRWRGVPILFTAGKALDERTAEVRVRFKPKTHNIFGNRLHQNELVMRIQPHESLYMKVMTKVPGLEYKAKVTPLAMNYNSEFVAEKARDAYERMILFAARGDGSLFVGSEELVEAWRVFTPMLHDIDAGRYPLAKYPFGSTHPKGSPEFAAKYGIELQPSWMEFLTTHATDVAKMKTIFESLAECSIEDGDCKIGIDGVKTLVREFHDGVEPTPERMQQVFSNFDVDKDGTITWEEFRCGAASLMEEFDIDHAKLDHTSSGS